MTTLILSGDYTINRSDTGTVRAIAEGTAASGGYVNEGGDFDTLTGQPSIGRDSRFYGGSAVLTHSFKAFDFTSTTASRSLTVYSLNDGDFTPPVLSDFIFAEVGDAFQQEFLLNGSVGGLAWTGGLFYFHNKAGWDPLELYAAPGSASNADRFTRITTESYAAFAQGTYGLSSNTNLTVGVRYTQDDSSIRGQYIARGPVPVPAGTIILDSNNLPHDQTHRDWDAVTWRVALDHQLTPDVLVYVSANRGFKSGTFNATDLAARAIDPEDLDAYEIGLKSDLFGDTVRFNVAAFYYDYTNIQLSRVVTTGTQAFNAPSGKLRGADIELAWLPHLPVGDLSLSGSASFLDAKYGTFRDAPISTPRNPAVAPFGGNVLSAGDASDNDMIKAPAASFNVTADYSFPLARNLLLGMNLMWQHSAKFYWEVDNRLSQPAYDVVNAQIYLGDLDDTWRARLWAKNALDEHYSIYTTAATFGDASAFAAPRIYGITLEKKFGGK